MFALLATLFGFLPMLAQAEAPNPAEWIPYAQAIFDAVIAGEWWAAVAALLAALGFVARRYGAQIWAPLATVPGIILTQFAVAFLGGLANAFAAGAAFGLPVLLTAFQIAAVAAGGWGAVEALIAWFSKKAPQP